MALEHSQIMTVEEYFHLEAHCLTKICLCNQFQLYPLQRSVGSFSRARPGFSPLVKQQQARSGAKTEVEVR